MEKGWSKIQTYYKPIEAEIVKQMLEENGIPAVLLNKQDSSYMFGKLELYVHDENIEKAKYLIDSNNETEIEGDDVN